MTRIEKKEILSDEKTKKVKDTVKKKVEKDKEKLKEIKEVIKK